MTEVNVKILDYSEYASKLTIEQEIKEYLLKDYTLVGMYKNDKEKKINFVLVKG